MMEGTRNQPAAEDLGSFAMRELGKEGAGSSN